MPSPHASAFLVIPLKIANMIRSLVCVSSCFLLLSLLACVSDDDPPINTSADFEAYVLSEMDDQNIPALSLLLFKEDSILYQRQHGFANLESNLPLAENHLFLLASVSKLVTATALLQLHEDGMFGLDEPINDHLPFTVEAPDYTEPITFKMLLTHTSGIADNDAVLDAHYHYNRDPSESLSSFIEQYFTPGGQYYDANDNFTGARPGEAHEYSNIGTALIAALVEQVSGSDFNNYCKQNIFGPLGMTHTAWRLDEITSTIVTPYDYVSRSNQPIEHYTNTDYPNGGLRSTAVDMFRLLSAFVQDGVSQNHQLLSKSTIDQMTRLQIPALSDDMGYHMFLLDISNTLWGHDGGEQGVATIVGFNPSTKIGSIIFTNQGEAELDELFVQSYLFAGKL